MTSSQDLQPFLDIATEAALAAGAILRSHFGNLKSIEKKGASGNLVTEADHAAEAKVLGIIQHHFPNHAILAEEGGKLGNSDSDYLWAVDPLDGTTNYAHSYPVFAVSIGLMINDVPQVGVVYDPMRRELFQAANGMGAWCDFERDGNTDRQPMRVSTTASLQESMLVTGFAYDRRQTSDNNYAEFCHLTDLTHGVRRGGSAAIDLAYVASGRLDGYWERGLSPWDLTAGMVLVQEAGGTVTAYDESPLEMASGRILATNGVIHQELSQTLMEIKPLAEFIRTDT
ncbi:MAG: inositol monophosphatase family protein [Cyanobacteria bacterium J06638_20]